MKFKAQVFIVSVTNPWASPIVLTDAEVEMTYDYVDHMPSRDGLIVEKLEITPTDREPQRARPNGPNVLGGKAKEETDDR